MELNSSSVKALVDSELTRGESFLNRHGITEQNLGRFLVEPFPVLTDSNHSEAEKRIMWVVLQECTRPTQGYVIVYDPLLGHLNVAEHLKDERYVVVTCSASLADALDGM